MARKTMRRYPRKIMRRAASDLKKGLIDTERRGVKRPYRSRRASSA